ncbi:hypothetical protein BC832DRAFT_442617 [Gaertneriomyces semiglobifer]|nr:hypothetical protein BC832DRAFT_442617 [Gaertneriomyces semiglobifer]
MLIVPIGHYPSTRQMQMLTGEEATTAQSALAEIAQIKSRIAAVYEERKEVMVCFEVFGGGAGVVDGNRLQHMHVQVVPVPAELRSKIEEVFEEECRREDLEAVEEEQPSDDAVTPYCRVEFPGDDGKTRVLVFSPSAAKMDAWRQGCAEAAETGRRPPRLFNLQFGR